MARLISLSLVIMMSNTALAQDAQIVDSLTRLLTKKVGADRYEPLYELAFEYIDRDNFKALQIIEEAGKAALTSGDSLWIVKSMRVRGQVLYKLERMDQAISLLETAIRIAERNHFMRERQMIANTFGSIYLHGVQLDKALHYSFLTWELASRRNDNDYVLMSLNNIGITYHKLGDIDKALRYLFESFEVSGITPLKSAMVLVNLSICYSSRKEFDSARFYLQRCIQMCNNSCTDKVLMHIKFASGLIHHGKSDFEDAERDFLRALEYAKTLRDSRMTSDIIYALTGMFLEWNQISKAEDFLEEGEKLIASGIPFPDASIEIYKRLAELHLKNKSFNRGAEYLQQYVQLKDSIYNGELTAKLMTKEAEFQNRINRAEVQAQAETIKLNHEIIRRQKSFNVLLVLLIVVSILLMLLLLFHYRKNKKINIILDEKVRERTRELEVSRNHLVTELKQKELMTDRFHRGICENIDRLKRLRSDSLKDVSDPIALEYIRRIGWVSLQIERFVVSTVARTEDQ